MIDQKGNLELRQAIEAARAWVRRHRAGKLEGAFACSSRPKPRTQSEPMILWRWTRPFVRWWLVTFVIGDDSRVAAAIAVGLLATWGLVAASVTPWSLLPLVVLEVTVRSLYRAVLRER